MSLLRFSIQWLKIGMTKAIGVNNDSINDIGEQLGITIEITLITIPRLAVTTPQKVLAQITSKLWIKCGS